MWSFAFSVTHTGLSFCRISSIILLRAASSIRSCQRHQNKVQKLAVKLGNGLQHVPKQLGSYPLLVSEPVDILSQCSRSRVAFWDSTGSQPSPLQHVELLRGHANNIIVLTVANTHSIFTQLPADIVKELSVQLSKRYQVQTGEDCFQKQPLNPLPSHDIGP